MKLPVAVIVSLLFALGIGLAPSEAQTSQTAGQAIQPAVRDRRAVSVLSIAVQMLGGVNAIEGLHDSWASGVYTNPTGSRFDSSTFSWENVGHAFRYRNDNSDAKSLYGSDSQLWLPRGNGKYIRGFLHAPSVVIAPHLVSERGPVHRRSARWGRHGNT